MLKSSFIVGAVLVLGAGSSFAQDTEAEASSETAMPEEVAADSESEGGESSTDAAPVAEAPMEMAPAEPTQQPPPAALGALTVDVQVRPRMENSLIGNLYDQGNQGLRASGGNPKNHMISQRSRLTANGAFGAASMRLSVQDVRVWGSEANTLGDFAADAIDVHEAWGQFTFGANDNWQLRAGRQELGLDGERLVGAVNWTQQARSFDGMLIRGGTKDVWELTLFGARVADGSLHDLFIIRPWFVAGGAAISVPIIVQTNAGVAARDKGGADFTRVTGGAHVSSEGKLFWRVEGYVQAGTHPTLTVDSDAMDVMAFMAAAKVGYHASDVLNPELWIDFVGGDTDFDDDSVGAFDTLFATNHKFYGFMDRFLNVPAATVGGGLIDIALKNTAKVGGGKLMAHAHVFMLAAENAAGQSGPIGGELDVVFAKKLVDRVKLLVGASGFLDMGDWAERSDGSDKDKPFHDWIWVMLDVNTAG